MNATARTRIFLARHRWVRWTVIAAIAAGLGWQVSDRLRSLDKARDAWGETVTVLIARTDLDPDGPIDVRAAELPVAAVPDAAVRSLGADARLHQRVTAGEVLTRADLVAGVGPAIHADEGTAVVGVADPLVRTTAIGLRVQVAADGLLLSAAGTVVGVDNDIVFIAVPVAEAPSVAAAASNGTASLIHVP